jgi:glycosyltransferase involved in cell wall biosynthesis
MKILVAAKALDVNRTSEGICSAKFLVALRHAGHEVVCVSKEAMPVGSEGVRIHLIGRPDGTGVTARLKAAGKWGTACFNKLDACLVYGTGFGWEAWHEVKQWRHEIRCQEESERPQVIMTRAAGMEFEPHLAMLGRWSRALWVANYHDPYPLSLYPEPYRKRWPVFSARQEAMQRRILREADALTFPSRRLLEWVLRDEPRQYRKKAFVVPHLAMDLDTTEEPGDGASAILDAGCFSLVHTGTLLNERDPSVLIDAFEEFLRQGADRRQKARLLFAGKVLQQPLASAAWARALHHPNISCISARLSYSAALRLTRSAVAAVVLEANAGESPFFPAKLTDYLRCGKPVLALTPRNSVIADMLGAGYPLLAAPDDRVGLVKALNVLWNCWIRGQMDALRPPSGVVESLSEQAVCLRLDELFGSLLGAGARRPSTRNLTPAGAI